MRFFYQLLILVLLFTPARAVTNPPVDTDGDGTPDFLDLDSDDDGARDEHEGVPDYRDNQAARFLSDGNLPVRLTVDDGIFTTIGTRAAAPVSGKAFPLGIFSVRIEEVTPEGNILQLTLEMPPDILITGSSVSSSLVSYPWDGVLGSVITGNLLSLTLQESGLGDEDSDSDAIALEFAPHREQTTGVSLWQLY